MDFKNLNLISGGLRKLELNMTVNEIEYLVWTLHRDHGPIWKETGSALFGDIKLRLAIHHNIRHLELNLFQMCMTNIVKWQEDRNFTRRCNGFIFTIVSLAKKIQW